ncbi:helix-turn-helix transcriptional regulator [Pedobacter sp. MC2016-15]|uniref:helix-turn-helix domain-containing protein n=1 Tax=Pedobacter sp. MC2016-15 TaxID=2994473 RepID=UPI0022473DE4|nr:helix-turn-helix transcriptional regulator [Pedobacter sp. MC2016-15]MCX2481817.1 helix-turn-helix transcriptional regulator [Pedobacter sp. MC2016-15]
MTQNIGTKLKALRLTHCLSQKVIADQLGISVPAYSKIETGLTDIYFSKLEQIADIYSVSVIDLLKIGERDAKNEQYPDIKRQLDELTTKYNEQQKKMIQLHEIIRNQRNESAKI